MDSKPKSYKDLEIYQVAFDLALRIRENSLKLPNPDRTKSADKSGAPRKRPKTL